MTHPYGGWVMSMTLKAMVPKASQNILTCALWKQRETGLGPCIGVHSFLRKIKQSYQIGPLWVANRPTQAWTLGLSTALAGRQDFTEETLSTTAFSATYGGALRETVGALILLFQHGWIQVGPMLQNVQVPHLSWTLAHQFRNGSASGSALASYLLHAPFLAHKQKPETDKKISGSFQQIIRPSLAFQSFRHPASGQAANSMA